jgi:hypothetical protein
MPKRGWERVKPPLYHVGQKVWWNDGGETFAAVITKVSGWLDERDYTVYRDGGTTPEDSITGVWQPAGEWLLDRAKRIDAAGYPALASEVQAAAQAAEARVRELADLMGYPGDTQPE